MAYQKSRVETVRIEKALEAQNQPFVDDGTFNDNYDPMIAQERRSINGQIIGEPNTDCYGLETAPFNECANFLEILQIDNRVTAYYGLIVKHLTESTNPSREFTEGILRSIANQMFGIDKIGKRLMDSIFSKTGGTSYWENERGERIRWEDEATDPNLDLRYWFFKFYPGVPATDINLTDYNIWNSFTACMDNLALGTKDFVPFDFSGEKFTDDCNVGPYPFDIGGTGVRWWKGVADVGPDAVRRGKITEDDTDYNEEATFYNMCVQAPDCIKEYKDRFPEDYESDLAFLTSEQVESLRSSGVFSIRQIEIDSIRASKEFFETALRQIATSYSYSTKEDYYSEGKLNNEVLYRVAIANSAIRNMITVFLESITALETTDTIEEYRRILAEQKEEQQRRLLEEEEMRILKQSFLAERFDVCRVPEQPIPNECPDKNSETKTFMADWTTKDRNSPYYSSGEKKYYLVYDVVLENFQDITSKTEEFKLDVYRILNNIFSLNMPADPSSNITPLQLLIQQVDIYFEARSFKPSKILFSLDETLISPEEGIFNPRFQDPLPELPYLRTYSYTIDNFFSELERFENMLKKYVFDFSLWKGTFGNVNPEIANMSVSSSPIFSNIRTSILKQDSKNFRMFRPLFAKLLSMNGIAFLQDKKLIKTGQYSSKDQIVLIFSFDSSTELPTVSGTTIVNPKPVNSLTKPPTNNSSTGILPNLIQGQGIKLHRVQIKNPSRPPVDLLWKKADGTGGNLDGLNSEEIFQQETAMNYLLNMDTILAFVDPRKRI